jgi:hypothetical protein
MVALGGHSKAQSTSAYCCGKVHLNTIDVEILGTGNQNRKSG